MSPEPTTGCVPLAENDVHSAARRGLLERRECAMPDDELTTRKPTPLHRPVTEEDIERALLANIASLLSGDIDQAAEQSKFFVRHRMMAATSLAKLLIQNR